MVFDGIGFEIVFYGIVKVLLYFEVVVNEGFCLYLGVGVGLLCVVFVGGMMIFGYYLMEGMVVSLLIYILYRSKVVWGVNVDEFYFERWIDVLVDMKKEMMSFFVFFLIGLR